MFDTLVATMLDIACLWDADFDQEIDTHLRALTGIAADDLISRPSCAA